MITIDHSKFDIRKLISGNSKQTEELIKFMEKEIDDVKQNVDEESKKREKKQTKRSGTTKTSS